MSVDLYRHFVAEKLGKKFVESRSPPFEKSYEETSAVMPVLFILSPGVDPLKVIFFYFPQFNNNLIATIKLLKKKKMVF